jgi:hypothetical protein
VFIGDLVKSNGINRLMIAGIVTTRMSHSSMLAKEGLLNSSYDEVASILGKPSSHDNGNVSGIRYDRYHFETLGWKAAVLFIDGKAQKLDTEKSDGSPLSVEDKRRHHL